MSNTVILIVCNRDLVITNSKQIFLKSFKTFLFLKFGYICWPNESRDLSLFLGTFPSKNEFTFGAHQVIMALVSKNCPSPLC